MFLPCVSHRSGSSFLLMWRTSLKMPKTWSADSSAAESTGWVRTALRTSNSTHSFPALTGRTSSNVTPPTSLTSAVHLTHQTLMWMTTALRTRYCFKRTLIRSLIAVFKPTTFGGSTQILPKCCSCNLRFISLLCFRRQCRLLPTPPSQDTISHL